MDRPRHVQNVPGTDSAHLGADAGASAGSAPGFQLDRAALPSDFERLPFLGESVHGGSPRRVFPDEGSPLVNGPTSVGRFDHELDHVPKCCGPTIPYQQIGKAMN